MFMRHLWEKLKKWIGKMQKVNLSANETIKHFRQIIIIIKTVGTEDEHITNQIEAAMAFAKNNGIDAEDEYKLKNWPRKTHRILDEHPETSCLGELDIIKYYRKEFCAVVDILLNNLEEYQFCRTISQCL